MGHCCSSGAAFVCGLWSRPELETTLLLCYFAEFYISKNLCFAIAGNFTQTKFGWGNLFSLWLQYGLEFIFWPAICRYVQAPLAYPRERKRRMNGGEDWLPFCIYSDGQLTDPSSPCYWSDYYSANPRTPQVTQLAPWVDKYYLHRKILWFYWTLTSVGMV